MPIPSLCGRQARAWQVRWWRCYSGHVFPALEPAPGGELICPCYFEEAEEWCMTSFIYMPYDSAEAAAAGERPVGEKWAPWAR